MGGDFGHVEREVLVELASRAVQLNALVWITGPDWKYKFMLLHHGIIDKDMGLYVIIKEDSAEYKEN